MSTIHEPGTRTSARPVPDEVMLAEPRAGDGGRGTTLRVLGALAVLAVGAVHLEQYFAVHFSVVPVIGPLFALNFAGAAAITLGLLLPPLARLRVLLALGGIALAVTSAVFFFIGEHRPLFGFEDYGYRPAILAALAAEAAAVVLLGSYLGLRRARSR
ncbi:MAG TPA: hypothetical protein VFW41_01960 [Gaiellaceae bacterium]|nr:hypothetical protein [Gaiellaceae bacterium]